MAGKTGDDEPTDDAPATVVGVLVGVVGDPVVVVFGAVFAEVKDEAGGEDVGEHVPATE